MRWRSGIFIFILIGLGLAGISAFSQTLNPPSREVPNTYFGIHNFRFHDVKMRPTIDFGTWRLWDTGTNWAELQPQKSIWNFTRLDLAVSIANARGMEPVLTLGMTPSWASMRPNESSFYGPGKASPPTSVAEYENYVETVARKYSNRIRIFETWNEPASGAMFSGSIEQMVAITAAANKAVKRVSASNMLVCPSPAKTESLAWFANFVRLGGAKHCDVIGYHFYEDRVQPETRLELVQKVQTILATYGLKHMPIWDTESGFSTSRRPETGEASNNAHLARWMILTWVAGVERFYWYSWDHTPLGFVSLSGLRNERLIDAYKIVQRWMLGSRFKECSRSAQLWHCNLTLKDGKAASIFWTDDNSNQIWKIVAPARVEDLNGFSGEFTSTELPVNGDPILIIW